MFYLTSFLGGLIAFFSPCVLPLLPGYLGYISGISLETIQEGICFDLRKKIFFHSIFFVLGFSLVFVALGITATALGKFFIANQFLFQKISGVLVFILGLNFLGILKWQFLMFEKRVHLSRKPLGYLETFLFGATFAFSWTPCVGPILASVFLLAATQTTLIKGALGLLSFSSGIGLPFIIFGLFFNAMLINFKNISSVIKWTKLIGGIFLLITGAAMFFNLFSYLTGFLSSLINFSGI